MGILYFKLIYMITTEMTITLEHCCHKRFMILSFFWIFYEFYCFFWLLFKFFFSVFIFHMFSFSSAFFSFLFSFSRFLPHFLFFLSPFPLRSPLRSRARRRDLSAKRTFSLSWISSLSSSSESSILGSKVTRNWRSIS